MIIHNILYIYIYIIITILYIYNIIYVYIIVNIYLHDNTQYIINISYSIYHYIAYIYRGRSCWCTFRSSQLQRTPQLSKISAGCSAQWFRPPKLTISIHKLISKFLKNRLSYLILSFQLFTNHLVLSQNWVLPNLMGWSSLESCFLPCWGQLSSCWSYMSHDIPSNIPIYPHDGWFYSSNH